MGYALLILSILLYLGVVGYALPRWLLHAKFLKTEVNAHGVRRCVCNGKRCVVYHRGAGRCRYVSKYLLCEGEDCKYLQCMMNPDVKKIRYDVVLFDRYDRVFDVVRVDETLASPYTKLLRLPDETSYVDIKPRKVNGETVSKSKVAAVKPANVALYSLLAFVMTVITGLFVTVGVSTCFGGVYREDFIYNLSWAIPLIFAGTAIVGIAVILLSLRILLKGQRKEKKKG